MKIMHEQVIFPGQSTIRVKWSSFPQIIYPMHFHSEHEIMFVHRSFGTYFVADSIEHFDEATMVLIGSHVPHFWSFDNLFRNGDPHYEVRATVIHFPEDFFKDQFSEYPEFYGIKQLLKYAERGISFSRSTSRLLEDKVLRMHRTSGFDQVILLLEILHILSKCEDQQLLASEGYKPEYQEFKEDRLSKVINYLNYRYKEKISLEEVAKVASLHPTAFCRFFKEKTSRTLLEFVNEMRIGYACKLLMSGQLPVSQICYESGFNNLANFNRQFKNLTKFTPSEYQQHYLQ